MPRLMSKVALRAAKQRFMRLIGLVKEENQAHVDAATMLIGKDVMQSYER